MSKSFYRALGKKEEWPNVTGVIPSSLTYDDVLLVPQISDIRSRTEINTSVKLGPYTLSKPIISAPMDTISGEKMARELARLGAIGTIPRGDINKICDICKRLTKENVPAIYAVGLKNGLEDAKLLKNAGAKIILIDIAHGGMEAVGKMAEKIKKELKVFVMTGNIATYDEAKMYKKYGVDIIKVGIGPGGTCVTRLVAGTGFPQLSAIFEVTEIGTPVIADGGIKKPGDFAKAIAAGADFIMIGSILGGTDETPGNVKNGKKTTRGQASLEYMEDNGVSSNEFRSPEGISVEVSVKGPAENVINHLMGGLRSAMTYAGAKDIKDFQKKAQFSMVSAATANESKPWLADK